VLSLGVGSGTAVRVCADGPDAAEAVAALCALVERNFGETD
jgi:phosphotransferase system HPr-like phosphotransfer protein